MSYMWELKIGASSSNKLQCSRRKGFVCFSLKTSFIGAMVIADLVKTMLGPNGVDKILQSTSRGHNVTVTNDGATILKSLHIDNHAAKVLVDISKVQDDEVGDGTTSVVVLAGELLREAEKLVNTKIHPMTIIQVDLMKIAQTTLSSKILSQDKEHFAKLVVDAVMRLKGSTNLESIQIIKKPGGSLKDSFLDEGILKLIHSIFMFACLHIVILILGSNWCEVNVKVILEPEEELIRPYENLQKVEDTLGEMIAWPCHLVIRSED
ncbi:hypothetical protein ACS0TY_025178 [Phlomoides rotata]